MKRLLKALILPLLVLISCTSTDTIRILHCDFKKCTYSLSDIYAKMGISDKEMYIQTINGDGTKLIFSFNYHKLYWFDLEKGEITDSIIFPYQKGVRYYPLVNANYTTIISSNENAIESLDTIPFKLIFLNEHRDSTHSLVFYDYNTSFSREHSLHLAFITVKDKDIYLTSIFGATYKIDIAQKRLIYKLEETIDIQNGKIYGDFYQSQCSQDSIRYHDKKYKDYHALLKDNLEALPRSIVYSKDSIKVFNRENVIMRTPKYEEGGNEAIIAGGIFYRLSHAWVSYNHHVEEVNFDTIFPFKYGVEPFPYGFWGETEDSLFIFKNINAKK